MLESNSTGARGAEPRLPSAFTELISPMTVEEFTSRYWEREHFILRRENPGYYANLMTLADMDHLIATSRVRSADLRLMTDGQQTPIAELVTETGNGANAREAVYAQYRKGATVNLLFLEQHWDPLERLCQSLTEQLGSLVHVNSYLTPAGTRGLTEHHDTHDVFVAQVYGSKSWRLYPQQVELPLRSQRYKRPDDGPAEPIAEFTLHSGDLLYMPRGTVHQAMSQETGSLHLTIGVTPIIWATVLEEAIQKAVKATMEADVRFRGSLPLGFAAAKTARLDAERQAAALLQRALSTVRPQAVVAAARTAAVLARKPALNGHLLDLERLSTLDLDSKLARRPDLLWNLADQPGGAVALEFNGKQVGFPEHVVEQLRFAGTAELFTGREIPGVLDDDGRLVLIQTLVREGFLTLPQAQREPVSQQPA